MKQRCIVCGKRFERSCVRHTLCSDECSRTRYLELESDRNRRRQLSPEHVAKTREKQNRLFKTSDKYRDRHRDYMRDYMRKRRAAKRAARRAEACAE